MGQWWTPRTISCGTDKSIAIIDSHTGDVTQTPGGSAFSSISAHRHQSTVAVAASSRIVLYDLASNASSRQPLAGRQTLAWPTSGDTISSVQFNQTETSILATCGTDRSIIIYDLRTSMPVHKTVLSMPCHDLAWNPQEAFNFAVANEDHNLYHVSIGSFALEEIIPSNLDSVRHASHATC